MQHKVAVFGIFDGVHNGHRDLFKQALRQAQAVRVSKEPSGSQRGKPAELKFPLSTPGVDRGCELIVIVGRDSVAEKLKGKKPKYSQEERIAMLKKEKLVNKAVLGDAELSSYKILEQLKPDVICVGYDQTDLESDLRKWLALRPFDTAQGEQASLQEGRGSPDQVKVSVKLYVAKPYKKDALHNSIL